METILFENYQKYQKEYRGNLFRAIFKLPVPAIALLLTLVLVTVLGIVTIFVNTIKFIAPYTVAIETTLCIIVYFYTDRFRIKNSDKRLTKYAEYCSDVATWLKGTGFVFNEKNVEQLIIRVSAKLDKAEKDREKRKDAVEKWVQILLIPVLLAVFSQAIQQQEDIAVLIAFAVLILSIVGLCGVSFISLYNILEFFRKRKIEQLRSFVEDLQGVLDTQFDEKLYGKC